MFSDRVMDHVHNPRNAGSMDDATNIGRSGLQGEGPYIYIYLKIVDGLIEKASYESNGCPAAIASASVVCQVVSGKKVERMLDLSAEDVLTLLGGLPEGKEHMARAAMTALRAAIEDQGATL